MKQLGQQASPNTRGDRFNGRAGFVKVYALYIRDRFDHDETTLHLTAAGRDETLLEWLTSNSAIKDADASEVRKALRAGKLEYANDLMLEYSERSGATWARSEHDLSITRLRVAQLRQQRQEQANAPAAVVSRPHEIVVEHVSENQTAIEHERHNTPCVAA